MRRIAPLRRSTGGSVYPVGGGTVPSGTVIGLQMVSGRAERIAVQRIARACCERLRLLRKLVLALGADNRSRPTEHDGRIGEGRVAQRRSPPGAKSAGQSKPKPAPRWEAKRLGHSKAIE